MYNVLLVLGGGVGPNDIFDTPTPGVRDNYCSNLSWYLRTVIDRISKPLICKLERRVASVERSLIMRRPDVACNGVSVTI